MILERICQLILESRTRSPALQPPSPTWDPGSVPGQVAVRAQATRAARAGEPHAHRLVGREGGQVQRLQPGM